MYVNKPKLQNLESLRGIAAICVVYFHSEFTVDKNISMFRVNSEIWVDFFFILSGFVMGYAYLNKITSKRIDFKTFITLRFGRLVPLNTFILICWIPYVLVKYYAYNANYIAVDPSQNYNFTTFFTNLFLIQSFNIHDNATWNGPSWSISTEFYTYILMFFTLIVMRTKTSKRGLLFIGISVLSYILLLYFSDQIFFSTFQYGFFRCVGGFFLGLITYFYGNRFIQNKPSLFNHQPITHIIELSLLFLVIFLVSNINQSNYYTFSLLFVFAVIILVFSIQSDGIVSQLLLKRPILFLGKISYSIYLTHALILVVFTKFGTHFFHLPTFYNQHLGRNLIFYEYSNLLNMVILVIIISASQFTYRYIELPYRNKFRKIVRKD